MKIIEELVQYVNAFEVEHPKHNCKIIFSCK